MAESARSETQRQIEAQTVGHHALFCSFTIDAGQHGYVRMGPQIFRKGLYCSKMYFNVGDAEISTTSTQDCKEFNFDGKFRLSGTYGMFSGSANLDVSAGAKTSKHLYVIEERTYHSKYKLSLPAEMVYEPQEYVHPALRKKMNDPDITMEEVEEFFGHFYSAGCDLGAEIVTKTIVEHEKNEDAASVRAELQAQYGDLFNKVKASAGVYFGKREKHKNSSIKFQVNCYGGEASFMHRLSSNQNLSEVKAQWAKSASDNDALLYAMNHDLRPSWKIVKKINGELGNKYEAYLRSKFKTMEDEVKALLKTFTFGIDGLEMRDEKTHKTISNDWGDGNTVYLDRHHVNAPRGRILTGFRLFRPSDKTIAYEFKTVAVRSRGNRRQQSTPFNEEGGGMSIFLDRHKVMAQKGHFLTGFRLKRNGHGKYRYEYESVPCDMGPDTYSSTKGNDWGGANSIYLDRHHVKVPPGHGLRGFHLYRPSDKTIAIEYWYAAIKG